MRPVLLLAVAATAIIATSMLVRTLADLLTAVSLALTAAPGTYAGY